MNTQFKSIIIASALMALSAPVCAQSAKDIQVDITFDRTEPVTRIYQSLELQIRQACRKAHRATTKTYKNRVVFDCQKDLMDQAVQVLKMPTLLAYHKDQIRRG